MSSSVPASTPGKAWQPPTPEELQPELPQYEIISLLGRGGMGAVYKARQKSLKREVAIKVLPPTIDDGGMQFAERFKAEAEAMARLNHPGVVAVYDAGETPGGLLYIVMEFVEGTDVSQMIRSSGRLPPEYAYSITAHVCDALAYAHANGLIHRDIKPANIMVDKEGRVKVADFGLAKLTNESSGFTQTNMAVGTPDFVAPEALFPGVLLDGRADLYAVGVMLYQMLTGSIPRGAFKPASVIVPGVDSRFDQIVFKAMQVDREERYQSSVELRQALDVIRTAAAEQAAPPPETVPLRRPTMQIPGQQAASAGITQAASQPAVQQRAIKADGRDAGGPNKSKAGMIAGMVTVTIAIGIIAFFIFHQPKPIHDTAGVTTPGRSAEEPLEKFLVGTHWLWKGSITYPMEFLADGTVEVPNWTQKGLVTGWKVVSPNEVELTILSGRDTALTSRIVFADDRDSFSGVDFDRVHPVTKSPRMDDDRASAAAISPATATKDTPFVNSLGMKFVPVPGTDVLFCIHEVRFSDYSAYAAAAQDEDGSWKDQSVAGYAPRKNKAQHPVMRVSWEDAQKFCAWLSQKEGQTYRLPTDEEWSIAVGLGSAEMRPTGTTPAMLSQKEDTQFPWGGDFPPQTEDKAGNYSDASRKAKVPDREARYLEDTDDGFPTTAAVMSFKPNKSGLYDMGGNVWEWCEDWFDAAQKDRVLRGGSWHDYDRGHLLSSFRRHLNTPGSRYDNYGFRCVLVPVAAPGSAASPTVSPAPAPTMQPAKPAAVPPAPALPKPAAAAPAMRASSVAMITSSICWN